MPYKYSGRTLRVGRSWKDNNNVTHPVQWATAWTEEEKTAKGITWEDDPAPFNSRFYWSADIPKSLEDVAEVDEDGSPLLDIDGNQVITSGLKTTEIAKIKQQAENTLKETDWMVIKASEVEGYTVPDDILAYRQSVRQESNDKEAAVLACTTLDEFINVVQPLEPVEPTEE